LSRHFKKQKNGFPGNYDEWISITPVEELKEIGKFSDGGSVDFTGLTPGQLKAIFVSENGYEPRSVKELVRGVKLYFKGMDKDGVPFGKMGNR
jgi:hypothetical protein